MIAIGALKACNKVDLDSEVLNTAKNKASILHSVTNRSRIDELEKEFKVEISTSDQLIKDYFLAQHGGWWIYTVHPEALNIIRNWTFEEKINYIADAHKIAKLASKILK